MKKTYIRPEIEIDEVEAQVLLANSVAIYEDVVESEDVLAPEEDDISW
jgi:hypothetical protein